MNVAVFSDTHSNTGRMVAELLFHSLSGGPCASALATWTLIEKESS